MKPSEFEEREYEGYLYPQISTNPNIWPTGQVFEHYIGIDYALLMEKEWLFNMHGFRRILPGAAPSRYRWPRRWFLRRTTDTLPSFRLNLFIQSKRSEWNPRASRILRDQGIQGLHWRFNIDEGQQKSLEKVWDKLKSRALVVYAAPAFHTHRDLRRYSRNGTLAEMSTFPSVHLLKGHQAWYYQQPGAVGVAHSKPERIEETPLQDRVQKIIVEQSTNDTGPWHKNLAILSSEILAALSEEDLEETSRLASFFSAVAEIKGVKGDFDYKDAWNSFYIVDAFCETFMLDWYVLQEKGAD
ncbi:MAG: hypothetical protein ACREKE_05290 [bacterium]